MKQKLLFIKFSWKYTELIFLQQLPFTRASHNLCYCHFHLIISHTHARMHTHKIWLETISIQSYSSFTSIFLQGYEFIECCYCFIISMLLQVIWTVQKMLRSHEVPLEYESPEDGRTCGGGGSSSDWWPTCRSERRSSLIRNKNNNK